MRNSTRDRLRIEMEGHVVFPPKRPSLWSFLVSIGQKLKRPFEMVSKDENCELENDVFY